MPAGVVTVTSVQETEAVLGGIVSGVSEGHCGLCRLRVHSFRTELSEGLS